MLIAVINQSTNVSDADVLSMTTAIADQVRLDAAPLWDRPPASVISYGTMPGSNQGEKQKALQAVVPAAAHGITLVDDIPDQPKGVLGYHTEDEGGKLWGIVATNPSLENGAKTLTGDWSVSSILSHEILEMYIDPNCNLWATDNNGQIVSFEVCDPVEGPTYAVNNVSVANFVTPAYFDPLAATNGKTKFDKLGSLKQPFTLLQDGYYIYATSGKEQQKQGAAMLGGDNLPKWRQSAKEGFFARTRRRRDLLGG